MTDDFHMAISILFAVLDKAVGNNSCFAMVMTNCFWATERNRNYHMAMSRLFRQQQLLIATFGHDNHL